MRFMSSSSTQLRVRFFTRSSFIWLTQTRSLSLSNLSFILSQLSRCFLILFLMSNSLQFLFFMFDFSLSFMRLKIAFRFLSLPSRSLMRFSVSLAVDDGFQKIWNYWLRVEMFCSNSISCQVLCISIYYKYAGLLLLSNTNRLMQGRLNKQNAENQSRDKHNRSAAAHLNSKNKPRYPLIDRIEVNNSIQMTPSNHRVNKPLLIFSQKQASFGNQSSVSLSVKQKYRMMHISTVHELINSARQKKQQIEDLLRKQQHKAEYEQLDDAQLNASLRKLKRVVRMMEITCKLILGKNQQNTYVDYQAQHQINLQEMNTHTIQNLEHEIKCKDSEIQKLKRLVELLSAPREASICESPCETVTLQNSIVYEVATGDKKEDVGVQAGMVVTVDAGVQGDRSMKVDAGVQAELITEPKVQVCQLKMLVNKSTDIQRVRSHDLHPQYSLWNILEAGCGKSVKQPAENAEKSGRALQLCDSLSPQKNQRRLQIGQFMQIKITGKGSFLKRYKSIVKIANNSLNLCANMLKKAARPQQSSLLMDELKHFMSSFNEQFHRLSTYSDDFCHRTKDALTAIYEKVQKLYRSAIKSDSRIFFD